MILALLALALPSCILAAFLVECHQHHRELEKAERDFSDPKTTRPNFFSRLLSKLRRKK